MNGDVWGYIIEDKDGEQVESCWGFYGYDYCETEGQEVLERFEKEEENAQQSAVIFEEKYASLEV